MLTALDEAAGEMSGDETLSNVERIAVKEPKPNLLRKVLAMVDAAAILNEYAVAVRKEMMHGAATDETRHPPTFGEDLP
ncbi:Uncharacterised protein [Mycobacterium tuberculosis]|nr:Uncharacterised protein [Mycobacterium tuberculosis]